MYPSYSIYDPFLLRNNGSEEIISLETAIDMIRNTIENEREDELFFNEILDKAPSDRKKEIITEIREETRKHYRILQDLYVKLTGSAIPSNGNNNVQVPLNKSYLELLEGALFSELDEVKSLRRILGAMPDSESYAFMFAILTDEIRHADLYNYLIATADK